MAVDASPQGLIADRRAQSLAGARRRSRRVRVLRYVLIAAMALAGVNVAAQLTINALSGGAPEASLGAASGGERIVNPRFTGQDQGGAPFTVTADAALRRSGGVAGLAELERPALDYAFLSSGDASEVLARTGVFDEAEQALQLREDVRLETESGYTLSTSAALIRLREGRVEGDAPVSGQAPWGAVRADAFEVRNEGRRVILTGDVRTRLYMTDPQEEQP